MRYAGSSTSSGRRSMRGVDGLLAGLWSGLRLLSVLLASVLVAGCATSGKLLEVFETSAPVPQFHPPLPAPVVPVPLEIRVLTPEVTRVLNQLVQEGEEAPYVFFCQSSEDYLTLATYNIRVLELIRQYRAIVQFYGHPELEKRNQ